MANVRIVAGSYDGLLYGWDYPIESPIDNKVKRKMKLTFGYSAHSECIKSVSLMAAKQGKTLVSGSNDETIKIYDVNKRVEIGTLMEQHGTITCLAFYGQSHLLSGSADYSICIWRTSDWNCLHILGGHKGEINSIAVHPSGKLAFSVARDRTLRMWNLVKGRIAYIRRLEKEAQLVLWSQSGRAYALCFGTEVSVFSANNAENIGILEHRQKIHCLAFIHDEYVVCGGEDKQLHIWSVTGRLLACVKHPDITARIKALEVVYPNGESNAAWIICATSNGSIQIWDFSDLTLDKEDPVEKNKEVLPISSTKVLSQPRITCLAACLSDLSIGEKQVQRQIVKNTLDQENDESGYDTTASDTKDSTERELPHKPHIVVHLGNENEKSVLLNGKKKRNGSKQSRNKKTKKRKV